MSDVVSDPKAGCQEQLDRFVRKHGVSRFRHTYLNLLKLLKQGGAPIEAVRHHLVRYWQANPGQFQLGDHYGLGHGFDHVELWGRGGSPLFLIGHPYQVNSEAIEMLNSMCQLGMWGCVSSNSWYGFGTVQVQVCHFATAFESRKCPLEAS